MAVWQYLDKTIGVACHDIQWRKVIRYPGKSRALDPMSQCSLALLVFLASRSTTENGGYDRVSFLGLLVLSNLAEFLATSVFVDVVFQGLNAMCIYGVAKTPDMDYWHKGTCIFLHLYVMQFHLSPRLKRTKRSIMNMLLFTQVRQLISISHSRKLTFQDLWPLPENLQLHRVHQDFKYDTAEPLFVIRAFLRMAWRPVLCQYVLDSLLMAVPLLISRLNAHILGCLDSSSQDSWYQGILYGLVLMLVSISQSQMHHVRKFVDMELKRVEDAINLEFFKIPLLETGLQKPGPNYTYQNEVSQVISGIMNIQRTMSSLFGTALIIWSTFTRIGWYALVPFCVSAVFRVSEWALEAAIGSTEDRIPKAQRDRFRFNIDDMCREIKTIKMFGWEKVCMDAELDEGVDEVQSQSWYVFLIGLIWFVFEEISGLSSSVASYATMSMYLHSRAGVDGSGTRSISNAELFELDNNTGIMRGHIRRVFNETKNIGKLVKRNRKLEAALRGELLKSLPRSNLHDSNASTAQQVPSVIMEKCNFKWWHKSELLKDVSFSASGNELVVVSGITGSGKSSLLMAMCGEMEMTQGEGQVVGRIGYLEQSAWITNDTARANILFGREFDSKYYWKVIHACALTDDIEAWPSGDMAVIGDRGINISGGQRARLALARAVYSKSDIYVLDDPLSSVDARVKRHILDHVILKGGLLGNNLRIMVTHERSILPLCNQIVKVGSGGSVSVVRQGVPIGGDAGILPKSMAEAEEEEEEASESSDTAIPTSSSEPPSESEAEPELSASFTGFKPDINERKWTNWENIKYAIRVCGMPAIISMVISGAFEPISSFILSGYALDALRANSQSSKADNGAVLRYLRMSMLSSISQSVLDSVKYRLNNLIRNRAVNDQVRVSFLKGLIHAPLSFFESTREYEVSSAYYDHGNVITSSIPSFLMDEFSSILDSGLSLYRVATTTPSMLLFAPLAGWIGSRRTNYIWSTIDDLTSLGRHKRVESSAVSQKIRESGHLIRLFGVGPYFLQQHMALADDLKRLDIPKNSLYSLSHDMQELIHESNYFATRCAVLLQSRFSSMKVTSGDLATSYELTASIIDSMDGLIGFPERFRELGDSIDLYRQYTMMEPEAPYVVDKCRPPVGWPERGKIEFCDFSMRYGAELEPALKNVNLTIGAGEKVGIVGRTGAGKSSLVKVLFRLLNEGTSGKILIDGQDISEIGVGDLRPRLGVIPQEPAILSGTLRQNLDPSGVSDIESLWSALIRCKIDKVVAVSNKKEEDDDDDDTMESGWMVEERETKERWTDAGWFKRILLVLLDLRPGRYFTGMAPRTGLDRRIHSNTSLFSNGQKQLFSLARLLMFHRQIVVLDEATANVDLETDLMIQGQIRNEFKDCTVLTIAHRLETVMQSDRIVVMDQGQVVQVGTPEELMDREGVFKQLVQSNEF